MKIWELTVLTVLSLTAIGVAWVGSRPAYAPPPNSTIHFRTVASTTYEVTLMGGQLSANPTEIEEGYFAVGQGMSIAVRQNSIPHVRLRDLVGKQVEVVIRVIE